jgi:hypothetical protein
MNQRANSRERSSLSQCWAANEQVFCRKMLSELSKSVAKEPAFIELMEGENLLWAEDSYSYQI